MIIELNEDYVATLVKAMHTALQHEQEAVATGQVDVFEVGKIKHVLERIKEQVGCALKEECDRRFRAIGFSIGD